MDALAADLANFNGQSFMDTLPAASSGPWMFDFLQGRLCGSAAFCRILSLPPGAPLDQCDLVSRIHPDDRAAHDAAWKGLLTGAVYEVDFRASIADETCWLHARAEPQFDANGTLLMCLGTLQNITSQKRAEAYLHIAAVAFDAQEGLLVTDANKVILLVNRAFTEITGYSAVEAIGLKPKLLRSGRHNAAFYAEMWRTIQKTGSWRGEIWNRRKNGQIYPENLSITAVKAADGEVTHYVGTLTDISESKARESEMERLAFEDALTQLPNRRFFLHRLQQIQASSARSGKFAALLFIDLDRFKAINDSIGHQKGDLLLQQIARRLTANIREGDTAARLGGDEFVVVLDKLSEDESTAAAQAERVARNILNALARSCNLTGQRCRITASIGLTLFKGQKHPIEDLLKRADQAMYQAKTAGRNALQMHIGD